MDNSAQKSQSDENSLLGKKRQQTQSPFTAATPKSRLGKEPKRPFGPSPLLNSSVVDENLEETYIEPRSTTFADSNSTQNTTADWSGCVDPNLEQTTLMDESTSSAPNVSKDLSMVEEADETDHTLADETNVTLADTFDEKVSIADGEGTPKALSPPPNFATSPSTPTAPTAIVSHLQSTVSSVTTSPLFRPKPQVDESLCEFIVLEQKVEHNVEVENLKLEVTKLQNELRDINEARIFEEKALMQQTEAVSTKAKADRTAAKEREKQLEQEIEELKAKLERGGEAEAIPDNCKEEELKEQLVELTAHVEVLTVKALKVDEMQSGMSAYKDKCQQIQNEQIALTEELQKARATIESLTAEAGRVPELEVQLKSALEMMKEAHSAEEELAEETEQLEAIAESSFAKANDLEKQLAEALQKISAYEEEKAERDFEHEQQLLTLREEMAQVAESARATSNVLSRIDGLQQDLEKGSHHISEVEAQLSTAEERIVTSETEMKTLKEDHEQEIEGLGAKFAVDAQRIAELSENLESVQLEVASASEKIREMQDQLTSAAQKLENVESERVEEQQRSVARIEELQAEIQNLRAASADVQDDVRVAELKEELEDQRKMMISEIQELESQLEAVRQQQQQTAANEELQKALESSEARIQELAALADAANAELTATIQKHTEETEELQKRHADKMQQVEAEAEKDALTHHSTLDSVRIQLTTALDKVAALETELQVTRKDAEQATVEIMRNREEELEVYQQKISELTTLLETAKKQSEFGVKEIQEASELKIQQLETIHQKQLETVHANNRKLESDVEAAKKRIEELEVTGKDAEQATVEIEKRREEELEGCRQKISELTALLDTAQQEKEREAHEIQEHYYLKTQELESIHQEKLDAIQENALKLLTGMDSAQMQIEELQKTNETIRKELQEELEAAKTQFDARKAQLEQKQASDASQLISYQETIAELQKELADVESDSHNLQALNDRIVELEASISSTQKELGDVQEALGEKTSRLEELTLASDVLAKKSDQWRDEAEKANEKVSSLEKELSNATIQTEVQKQLEEQRASLEELHEKLQVAEEALSQKENSVVTLESRIEAMQQQLEHSEKEADEWRQQAQLLNGFSRSFEEMHKQLRDMKAQLEASNQRVIEVEATAQHDVTLMREEVDGQATELEEARARIKQLEEELQRNSTEIERLEKVCDEFDDDEKEYKDKIYALQEEIRKMKGVESPPRTMGLLQQARLGIKPISRESSHLEQPEKEDGFEDAHDAFPQNTSIRKQKLNETARINQSLDATAIGVSSTTALHPDDSAEQSRMVPETPSKNKNRSNCQHQ
ncbi:unnamed protein product [Caenorhabditis sp. 36 PRJEB53466]|nr:unnamed protein product [Caenorhabditis sp. 36 PRJEB53466]